MNTGFFLARRLVSGGKGKFSFTFIIIAITSIGLGLAIMFIAVAILTAFKQEIREKVVGFNGHILITRFTESIENEPPPVNQNQLFLTKLKSHPSIRHVQVFATKTGIIKTAEHIQGVVFKGVGSDYAWDFFEDRMEAGHIFKVRDTARNDSVIISVKLSKLLELKLYDPIRMYFINGEQITGRKFIISGLFDTGLEEFDKLYVIGDIRHVQRISGWQSNEVGGFEVFIKNFDDIDQMGAYIYHQIGFSLDASTVKSNFQQIFDWLDLQDINVLIILILVIMVSSTTIVSTLLILILERTGMVGILKALGMKNVQISRMFLYQGMYITLRGMFWGNIVGFTLCLLQMKFKIVRLPEESYYMSAIPIRLDFLNIMIINAGTFLLCSLIFLLPTMVIARITPLKAIRLN